LNGDIHWLVSRDDSSEDHGYVDFMSGMDGIVMGRGTFEKVASFDPWPYTLPVIVLSKTLQVEDIPDRLINKIRIMNTSPSAAMKILEAEGLKHIYVDGGQLIQSFLRENLITDMVISTMPVLLGDGRPLFGSMNAEISLKHVHTKAFPSGLVQTQYTVLK